MKFDAGGQENPVFIHKVGEERLSSANVRDVLHSVDVDGIRIDVHGCLVLRLRRVDLHLDLRLGLGRLGHKCLHLWRVGLRLDKIRLRCTRCSAVRRSDLRRGAVCHGHVSLLGARAIHVVSLRVLRVLRFLRFLRFLFFLFFLFPFGPSLQQSSSLRWILPLTLQPPPITITLLPALPPILEPLGRLQILNTNGQLARGFPVLQQLCALISRPPFVSHLVEALVTRWQRETCERPGQSSLRKVCHVHRSCPEILLLLCQLDRCIRCI
mmetsp:Transcript_36312/g.96529  ORF Transcript_36312/g.96529 Transcript_36312/m.96529 type:complete len:268 (+) Transcript_36312:518-1321(+)